MLTSSFRFLLCKKVPLFSFQILRRVKIICIKRMKRARLKERKSMPHSLQVNFHSPEELFVYSQNDDVRKQKALVIGSRIRERDKKNAENYVGDYFVYIHTFTFLHPMVYNYLHEYVITITCHNEIVISLPDRYIKSIHSVQERASLIDSDYYQPEPMLGCISCRLEEILPGTTTCSEAMLGPEQGKA